MRYLPYLLVYFRLLIGILLFYDSLDRETNLWFVAGLIFAFFSDVFDGMIARRLSVASERLRVVDSRIDLFFIIMVGASAWFAHMEILVKFGIPLIVMLGLHIISLAIPRLRYGRFPAYHSYFAKAWGVTLFLAAIELFGYERGGFFIGLAILVGIISHLERLAITLILPQWTLDVSSVRYAIQLRKESESS